MLTHVLIVSWQGSGLVNMRIGLTGGIGCGKSTVVKFFAEAGWRTIEVDALVHARLRTDPEVAAALRARWGSAVFVNTGGVDQRAIARRVFADESERNWLEALLHPMVRSQWRAQIAVDSDPGWLVEIPLLFEKKLETKFDLIVCVTSPSDVVERRMVHRGYSGDEIKQRRLRQMPLREKVKRADYVILNAGNLEFLNQQTKRLIAQIQTRPLPHDG